MESREWRKNVSAVFVQLLLHFLLVKLRKYLEGERGEEEKRRRRDASFCAQSKKEKKSGDDLTLSKYASSRQDMKSK